MQQRKTRPQLQINNENKSAAVPIQRASAQKSGQMAQSAPAFASNGFFFPSSAPATSSAINPSWLQDTSMDEISSDILLTESIFPLTIDNAPAGGLMDMDMENVAQPQTDALRPTRNQTIPEDALFSPNDYDDIDSVNPSVLSGSLPESPYVSSSPIFFNGATGMGMQQAFSGSSLPRQQIHPRPPSQPSQFTSSQAGASRQIRTGSTASSSQQDLENSQPQIPLTTAHSFPGVANIQQVEMTKHIDQLEKRRKRRESHNAVERRRRDLINDKIRELSVLVPDCNQDDKLNKGTILCKSVDYIRALSENYRVLNEKVEKLEQELKKFHP